MADPINLKELMQGLEETIDARFGSHLGFQQVKAALEKKGPRPDARNMIMDSRAVFSGENKPILLAAEAVDNIDLQVTSNTDAVRGILDDQRQSVAASMEKHRAMLENRPANVSHEVKADEALFVGRLTAEGGTKPVAGARVIVYSSAKKPVKLAQGKTDANGEYVIKMDPAMVKKATKRLTLSYESGPKKVFASKQKITLASAMGKTRSVNIEVAEDKKNLVADLVKASDENKHHALVEMAELKKAEAELNQTDFKIRTSANKLSNNLAEIKLLFEND